MTRRLSKDERELWERLRRSVRPLRGIEATEAEASAGARQTEPDMPAAVRAAAPRIVGPPPKPALLPLVTMEERARRRLSRGLADVDARIDLHGMGQDRAFHALISFLRHSQARGARTVLVVTGKGRAGEDGRGILRQVVPAWLARPEFRSLVVGYDEAARRHGGAGALYVRVRRRRDRREVWP